MDSVFGHAHTARNDGHRLASVRPDGGVWIVSFGAGTSDGQTVRPVQPAARPMANLRLLRRTRLCEADPSPGLWPAPFSKGALAYGYFSIMR